MPLLSLVVALVLTALLPASGRAAARNITERWSTNTTGELYLIGNTGMTCDPGGTLNGAACVNGRAGTGGTLDNNAFSMVFVDEAGTLYNQGVNGVGVSRPTSAVLNLPSGSEVLWAGLYWGGESNADRARNQVTFTLPSGSSSTITASVVDSITGASGCTAANPCDRYSSFADVTNLVNFAGSGTYKVSNIQSWSGNGTGAYGHYAGWALVVAVKDTNQTLKNLTVFDGFVLLGTACGGPANLDIPVTGFLTPLSGPVKTTLGFVVAEGELGYNGDNLQLGPTVASLTTLVDTLHLSNNFFISGINDLGSRVTTKTPNYVNQLGWDLGRINASSILGNGATSAVMRTATSTECYFPTVNTFSTELYIPIVTPNVVKTGVEVKGGVPVSETLVPGDTLRYTISMSNTGLDTATNLMLSDNIPLYTSYVPGSLVIISGPAGAPLGAMSDASGDNAAEYVVGSGDPADPFNPPHVNFRLGAGADAVNGGSLRYLESTSLSFDVKLDDVIPSGTMLTNAANLSYNGQTLGTVYAAASSASTASIFVPPTVSKSFSPDVVGDWTGTSTLSIVFNNPGTNLGAVTGVEVTDTYPPGLVNANPANPSLICTPGSTPGSIVGGLAGGNTIGLNNTTIAQNGSCTLSVQVKINSDTTGVYINTLGQVRTLNAGNTTTPSATSTFSVGRPTIAKAFSVASIPSGTNANLTFTLTNPNASPLTDARFTDVLPAGLTFVSANASTCGGLVPLTAGNTTLNLTGGTIPAKVGMVNGSCTVTAVVTGSTGGSFNNTTSGVTSTQTTTAGPVSNTANLLVYAPLTATKTFFAPSISANGSSVLTMVISNPNPAGMGPITGIAFTDNYPTSPGNLLNTTTANGLATCTGGSSAGTLTAANGGSSIGISGGSIASGGSCTITVNVTSATASTTLYVDNADTLNTTNAGNSATIPARSLSVSPYDPPTATKVFTTPVAPGASSTLTITLTNPAANGAVALTLPTLATDSTYAMVDNYPANLVNSATPSPNTTCTGGTAIATAGGSSVILNGGTIPASGGSCTVTVNVTSTTPDVYYNNTGLVYTTNAGVGLGASGSISILTPPTITKSFSTNPVAPSGNTNLVVTVGNPSSNPLSLTGVGFTDNYPAGMTNTATAPTLVPAACGTVTWANGGTSLVLSNVTVAPGATCAVTKQVRAPAAAGPAVNTTDPVTSIEAGSGATATATLSVGNPGITKAFGTSPIFALTGTSVITFTLSNPTTALMTGAAFTDTYPTGMTNISPLTWGGTCANRTIDPTTVADGGFFKLNTADIPIGGTCTITVTVKSSITGINTIPAGGLTVNGGGSNANPASATLVVTLPPEITKSFSPASISTSGSYTAGDVALGRASTMTITISNPTSTTITNPTFTDTYPSTNLKNGVALTTAANISCTAGSTIGTLSEVINASRVRVTSGTPRNLLGNGTCTITVPVYATTAGSYENHTGTITSTRGTGPEAVATLTVLTPFTGVKSFAPSTVNANDVSVLTITLSNPNATTAVTGVSFSDPYPANLVNATPLTVATTCGGTVTATAGGGTLALSGGTIPANGSCTVTANVTSLTAGNKVNPAFNVSSANDGTSAVATKTLTVVALQDPVVTKTFGTDPVMINTNSLMTITLTNPAANGATAITGAAFTDTYPTGLVNNGGVVSNTCGGTVTVGGGNPGTLTLGGAGGTIPGSSGSCLISVNVRSATHGTYVNSTGLVTSSNAATGASASDSLTVVLAAPAASKAFNPTTQVINKTAVLTIALTNSNGADITGVNFTDTYPAGMVNSTTPAPAPATTCPGGAVTAVAGGNSLALSGATIPTTGCNVTVNVTSAAVASYTNSTGDIYSSNALTGTAVTGAIDYLGVPSLMIVKSAAGTASPGNILTYTVEVQNSGNGVAKEVKIKDQFSEYTDLFLDAYGPDIIFDFDEGTNPSGLPGTATVEFSTDGTTFVPFAPTFTNVGGYDDQIHAFRLTMDGNMNFNTSAHPSFQIHYKVRVK